VGYREVIMRLLQFLTLGFLATKVNAQQNAAQRTDCLLAHNEVRRNVTERDIPDLTYSVTLEAEACKWSKYLAEKGKFQHSGGRYGENLWKITYSRPQTRALSSCRPASRSWAGEKKFYQAGMRVAVDGDFSRYGHFTALVSISTKSMGCCGWRSPDKRSIIWTCEYNPPGNMKGVKAY
jgi:pathogenesis-related protein 1